MESNYVRAGLFNGRDNVYSAFQGIYAAPWWGWDRFDPSGRDRYFGDQLDLKKDAR